MDRDLLIIILVGGILTFGTYYYAYQSGKGMELWGGVEPKYRKYYTISGIFAGLVFIYLFYYYVFYREEKTEKFKNFVHVGMGFITFGSAAWVPLTFLGLKDPKYKLLSILALTLVSFGSILLLLATATEENSVDNWNKKTHVKKDKAESKLALAAGSIFVFHVTFLDLLSWGSSYLAN